MSGQSPESVGQSLVRAMTDPLRILIAEDHYLVREGTRRLLDESGTNHLHAVDLCQDAAHPDHRRDPGRPHHQGRAARSGFSY